MFKFDYQYYASECAMVEHPINKELKKLDGFEVVPLARGKGKSHLLGYGLSNGSVIALRWCREVPDTEAPHV